MFRTKTGPFAVLRPANELAKIAFSEVHNHLIQIRQGPQTEENDPSQFMDVAPEQEYDTDVFKLQLKMEQQKEQEQERTDQGSFSEIETQSGTEIDENTRRKWRHLGKIWTGCYVFNLEYPPKTPRVGWVLGKGPLDLGPNTNADLYLCTVEFSEKYVPGLKHRHGRLSFATSNRAFYVSSLVNTAFSALTVNATPLTRGIHALNQHRMTFWMGPLQYSFEYTDYASTEDFTRRKIAYMTKFSSDAPHVIFDMPTPNRETQTIGQWTLGKPLGRGSIGRVYAASNTKNEVVAVKKMERNDKNKLYVDAEIDAFRKLTELGRKNWHDGERIVQLREMTGSLGFGEVGLIMVPMTPQTMLDLNKSDYKSVSLRVAKIFRDALEGLKFLHNHNWVHRDLKPANIGVRGDRAVLLDVGQALYLRPGKMIKALPSSTGTPGYLCPERELTKYDYSTDIWAMGVIGFELTYGHRPITLSKNAWRPSLEQETLRKSFDQQYRHSIDCASADYESVLAQNYAQQSRARLHLGDLLVKMLKYQWATRAQDRARRIKIDEALNHPVWDTFLPETGSEAEKKTKLNKGK